jgi:hypothetical protein
VTLVSGGIKVWLILTLLIAASPADAWIHPEHRAIAGATIAGLDAARAQALRDLWAAARAGQEGRLCEQAWAADQGPDPACIDLAAFPALAGDHSCSPTELLKTILTERWVLDVARVASQLEARIRGARTASDRINATRASDLGFEGVDPGYSSRAGANNAHFLLARRSADPAVYLRDSVSGGAELNAMGIWLYSHAMALKLAGRASAPGLSAAARGELARAALAAEFYGEHFLQDTFAAGHVAGTWGKVATRKGTHDYYNEHGLATSTWSGHPVILAGDSHMRDEDRDHAAPIARLSLEQFLDALDPASPVARGMALVEFPEAVLSEGIETCKAEGLPKTSGIRFEPDLERSLVAILRVTPVPSVAEGLGALPRFRSEIGPFAGFTGGFQGAATNGSFDSSDRPTRAVGALNIGARVGIGLEALLPDAGTGEIFFEGSLNYRAKQRTDCPSSGCSAGDLESLFPRSPARQGVTARLRLPFWLIPGDLLVAVPVLVFTSPATLKKMAIKAADGGAFGVERGVHTPIGRFQLMIGRELGVTFYGYLNGKDVMLNYDTATNKVVPIAFKSIDYDIPVVEYRPFRDFATRQASSLLFQIGFGIEVPKSVEVVAPGEGPAPHLGNLYSARVKVLFDWRQYF